MAQPGLRLRHILFHSPTRPAALLEFGPGLNVIYGASECGKSFVVEAIDFMFGGKQQLRDIPERIGYDRIFMGIETLAGEQFTLFRSVDGGAFKVFPGLHLQPPGDRVEAVELADQHNEKNHANLSMYLLQRCAMDGKRVRRNKQGETNSLSFRNLARLLIVDETEIIAQRSPLSDGNPTVDTPNFATFKLLLTGVDDSALVSNKPTSPEDQSREAQLNLLDQLIDEHRARLADLTKDPADLEDQLQRLEGTLFHHASQLASTEAEYRDLANRRRDTRKKLEEGRDRRSEIAGLLERFRLLDSHYVSDVARLRGIVEGGTLVEVLGHSPCPLCGAAPEHHRRESDCDGNIEAVVAAARSEIAKIELLRTELADTIKSLGHEAAGFDKRLPKVDEDLRKLSRGIEELIAPKLTQLRANYAGLADKRGEVREALAIYKSITDAEVRRLKIETGAEDQKEGAVAEGDLSAAVAEAFALQVEAVLKDWHFPEAERVFFDAKSRDLVIAGKPRTARGKGLRAITHAAFTVGLLQFCKSKDTPHPSFVILDTPLRAYREPEGLEDDLTGTDLNIKFYDYLAALAPDRQVIIVENSDPPASIMARPQVVMFSKNPHSGRYGFFPMAEGQGLVPRRESL
jgi:septal ring factor EnvC (AmiA/AmiB activator)